MTDETKKTPASVRSHLPNAMMLLGGAALIVYGWTSPEQSADLVNRLVQFLGVILGGGGLLNTARVGVKQDVKQEIKQAVPSGDAVATLSDTVATLNDTVLRMIGGMERIQDDFREKHAENKEDHATLLASLAKDKASNDEQHAEHRKRLDKVEQDVADMRHEVGDEIRKLGEKIDGKA